MTVSLLSSCIHLGDLIRSDVLRGIPEDALVVVVDDVNDVNSSAAVPTTSTSITMPFRKNWGSTRQFWMEQATPRVTMGRV